MVITLGQDLQTAIGDAARRQGVAPEALALAALRERFANPVTLPEPRDDWERGLLSVVQDCGVSLPDEAFSRENLYD